MKAKRIENAREFLKRNRPLRWTVLLGVGLAALSGTLLPTSAQAAVPVSLTLKGQWPGSATGRAYDVAVQGQYAYVADGDAGLQVIDVSNPVNPVRVGGVDTSGSAIGVAVAGNHAYVADSYAGLQVIDVSDPTNPVRVGGVDTSGYARLLAVAGNYAYVADSEAGLQVIDVSDPTNPVRVGGYDDIPDWGYAAAVAVAGNYAYLDLVDGLFDSLIEVVVIDISNPANPVPAGDFAPGGVANVRAVSGDYAYVGGRWHVGGTNWISGLEVVDVSNPANPVRVGGYDIAEWPSGPVEGVALVGNLIYVAAGRRGLLILEQSTAPPPAEWVRIQTDPASTPRARHGHAMVYDEQREVILMHGGRLQRGDGTVVSDTWQWDGQTWTQVATNGPRVFQHNMAYDPSRGVTVLYGGGTPEIKPITGDTWEWNGQSWILIEVEPTTPPPSVWGGMAYDPERKKIIRHGGETVADTSYDVGATWEWNGQTWTQIADGFIRGGHSLLFDPVRGKMIAFGGGSTCDKCPSRGMWEFDGAQWNPITTEGPSARSTFNRIFVWDAHRGVGVLQGGIVDQNSWYGDTWEWDGFQWTQVNLPGPGRRGMHAMAYDAKRRKVVLFGGFRDCFHCDLNETWEYGLPPLQVTLDAAENGTLEIRWTGEAPPYQLQSRANLSAGNWQNEGQPTNTSSATVQSGGMAKFFRVLSLYGNSQ